MIILIPIFTKNIHQTLDLIPTARPVQIIGLVAQGVVKVAVEGTYLLFIPKSYIRNMTPSMLSQSPLEGLHFQVFVKNTKLMAEMWKGYFPILYGSSDRLPAK